MLIVGSVRPEDQKSVMLVQNEKPWRVFAPERAGSLHILHKEEVVLVYIKFRRSGVYI